MSKSRFVQTSPRVTSIFFFFFPIQVCQSCVCVCVNLTQCYGNAKKQKQTNNIIRLVLISFVIVRCVRTMRPTGTPEISCRLVSTRFIINTVVRPPQCLERYSNVIPLYKKKKKKENYESLPHGIKLNLYLIEY